MNGDNVRMGVTDYRSDPFIMLTVQVGNMACQQAFGRNDRPEAVAVALRRMAFMLEKLSEQQTATKGE